MGLLLRGGTWASRGREERGDIRVARGKIVERGPGIRPGRGDAVVDVDEGFVLPGLINGHDHLGLDLLPLLGDPPYRSFYDWAEEIYRPHEAPIVELERVRMRDRLAWGGWRNVLGGATSVAHHDPWHGRSFRSPAFPVRVIRCAWGHSLGFDAELERRYRPDRPFVVHAAEGVEARARAEIGELEQRGLLRENTVLVHAIALGADDIELLAARNTKVVWCPTSNFRLYGQSAPVAALLRAGVTVALGTDATLSGAPTLLHELRRASQTGETTPEELVSMVTDGAAQAFGLEDGRGTLEPGAPADIVVVPSRGSAARSLLAAGPRGLLLVVSRGRVRLAGADVAAACGLGQANIEVEGVELWVDEPFGALRARIDANLGADYAHSELWHQAR